VDASRHKSVWPGSIASGLESGVANTVDALLAVVEPRATMADVVGRASFVGRSPAGEGTRFDPDLIDGFLRRHDSWRKVAEECSGEARSRRAGAP
jgi:hypothetical protein